jgi:hypothetical protein
VAPPLRTNRLPARSLPGATPPPPPAAAAPTETPAGAPQLLWLVVQAARGSSCCSSRCWRRFRSSGVLSSHKTPSSGRLHCRGPRK